MTSSPPPPRFEHIANLHLDLAPGLPGGETPFGITNWFGITSGSLKSIPSTSSSSSSPSTPLDVEIISGGGDYNTVHVAAKAYTLDVHAVGRSKTGDNAIFRFHNTGVIHMTEKNDLIFNNAENRKSTEFGEEVVLERITCQTGSKDWGWLNYEVLIGQGRLLVESGKVGLAAIEFRIFRVCAS